MKGKRVFQDWPGIVKWIFGIVLALLVLPDPFLEKHGTFPWEGIPGFFAVYGFLSCVLIVVVSNLLGKWLKRKEDYYD